MSNRKVSSFTVRFFWPLMLCLGLGLMALVGLMSYRSDLHLASQNLTDATQYVKQQRTAYDRFNDTSMTKSLLRVIENAQQIDREIQYKIALTGLTQTVSKQQITIFQCIKFGIGHLPFIFTQHRLQRIQPEGISFYTLTILQRSIVMIKSHMQITFTVDTNTDNVVGILAFSFIR